MGRDPRTRPLTSLERQLYRHALYVVVKAEYEPREQPTTIVVPDED